MTPPTEPAELDYYLGLGPYERPAEIDWETMPPLARGTQPKDSIPAGIWPGSES